MEFRAAGLDNVLVQFLFLRLRLAATLFPASMLHTRSVLIRWSGCGPDTLLLTPGGKSRAAEYVRLIAELVGTKRRRRSSLFLAGGAQFLVGSAIQIEFRCRRLAI